MDSPQIDDYDERSRRLIAKGILTPPKKLREEGKKFPMPSGRIISQAVMDQIWEEEREDRA
jgi:hypothetical protein